MRAVDNGDIIVTIRTLDSAPGKPDRLSAMGERPGPLLMGMFSLAWQRFSCARTLATLQCLHIPLPLTYDPVLRPGPPGPGV